MRGGYGPNQPYTRMAARALQLWQGHERQWNRKFLHKAGVLWMAHGDDAFERASLAELRATFQRARASLAYWRSQSSRRLGREKRQIAAEERKNV